MSNSPLLPIYIEGRVKPGDIVDFFVRGNRWVILDHRDPEYIKYLAGLFPEGLSSEIGNVDRYIAARQVCSGMLGGWDVKQIVWRMNNICAICHEKFDPDDDYLCLECR